MRRVIFALLLLGLSLFGCTTAPDGLPSPTPAMTASGEATFTAAAPSPTPTSSPTVTPTAEPTAIPYTALCSPLEGETVQSLARPELLKNPFQPPRAGEDGGHFGVDFSYWTRPDGSSMQGLPVYSALDGTVAGRIENRFPYGNAVILETPLDWIDPAWLAQLPIADYDPKAPLTPAVSISCPDYNYQPTGDSLSLYLIYGHFDQAALPAMGEAVTCGQEIGQVGTTGKSVNYHLHLETRIGPAGMQFASMSHYDTSSTPEEMRNYCLWRLSGAFQALDPLALFGLQR